MPTDALTLDCETCDRSRVVRLDSAQDLVTHARAFFLAHAGCRTRIDLSEQRLDGWRVPVVAA